MWPTLGSRTAKEQNSPSSIWGGTQRVVSVYVHASGLLLACLRLLIVLLIEYIGIFLSSFFMAILTVTFVPPHALGDILE